MSIIEPGPVISNFVEKVMANSQSLSETGTKDKLTKEMIDTFMEKGQSRYATMGQTAEEVAAYVLKAIESPDPQLRYQTNILYSAAIEQKLNNPPHRNSFDAMTDSL